MFDPVDEFRGIILRVALFLTRNGVHRMQVRRLSESGWNSRVRAMLVPEDLRRQFWILLSMCTFREIGNMYRVFLRVNNLAMEAAATFVISRNMRDLLVVRDLMTDYDELMGK